MSMINLAGRFAKVAVHTSCSRRVAMATTFPWGNPVVLYADDRSPPVRSVLMLIEELAIPVDVVQVDLFKREQYTKEYLEINPQHTVPALRHGALCLHDSHTILLYLADTFATSDKQLLPAEPTHRIKVIDRLFFNGTHLFPRDSAAFTEIFANQPRDITHHLSKLKQLYGSLERYLGESRYMAGDEMTIADLSIVATLSTVNMLLPVDADQWPELAAWFGGMRVRNCYAKANAPGLGKLHEILSGLAKCDLHDYRL